MNFPTHQEVKAVSAQQENVKKLKVSLEPFQRLAVSKGRAFVRSPQRAKYFMLHKAQEGIKTFQWNVFRREPSQGVP